MTCQTILQPHEVDIITLFLQIRSLTFREVVYLPKVTQLVSSRDEFSIQVFQFLPLFWTSTTPSARTWLDLDNSLYILFSCSCISFRTLTYRCTFFLWSALSVYKERVPEYWLSPPMAHVSFTIHPFCQNSCWHSLSMLWTTGNKWPHSQRLKT